MKFLIVNDDGYQAEGLKLLVDSIKSYGEVVVYSPFKCESAQSQKITIHKGIKVEEIELSNVEAYAVHGSTADCVRIGLFLNPDVDIVLSGINHGLNVGHDIYYSSTLAGIVQAGMQGYRGVAFSCDKNYDDVAGQIENVLSEVIGNNESYEPLINVNFPKATFKTSKGIKMTLGGQWHFENKFNIVDGLYFESNEIFDDMTIGTDNFELSQGYVSISNISLKRTY